MPNLKTKLNSKTFVITCELDPPRGSDPEKTLAEARAVKPFVDAVNISDSPQANLRIPDCRGASGADTSWARGHRALHLP
jgi:5,10-methylenetetrahydrofolate reductase